jgi:hypothetical protein
MAWRNSEWTFDGSRVLNSATTTQAVGEKIGSTFPGDDRYGERPDERVTRVGSEIVHRFQEELDLERMVHLQVAEQSRVGRAEKYLAALILMPTEQDSATHLLNSRRLAGSLAKHISPR